ncbi:MAG TPA: 3-dehydroquinate synthase [Gemmatimonadales bacterium]|nr:3-dehydroquinate synthase [Gemmatimonadales bacterium]
MPIISVRHSQGEYQVHVEPGLLLSLHSLLVEPLAGRRLALITDDTVAARYDEWTSATATHRELGARASDAGIRLKPKLRLTFPAGEASKTRETWTRLSDQLLAAGFDRNSAIVALGGGVVGDLAGFVAATYLRGLPYAQVPTSLVAMLDASVGGKVAVDTEQGKNLIGAFHPPAIVVADPLTLLTLPEREYRGGMAEAVKHGVIADAGYFTWIEGSVRQLGARDLRTLERLVVRSIEIKANVVEGDERERGRRAILNAGHTVAHAIEQVSRFVVSHGEAVSIGLVAECRLSERLGLLSAGSADRIAQLLHRLGLPVALHSTLPIEQLLTVMASDKKNRLGQIRFALPAAIGSIHPGDGHWTTAVPADQLGPVLQSVGAS